ncbi:MAG: PQQ-binding-like beta-propeller repeat protein [Mariniblastus sp.]
MTFRIFTLSIAFLFGLLACVSNTSSGQENWTRFHGPNGTGLAAEAKLPSEITDDNFEWKIELAGTGSSAPVIWGDKIFVTGCDQKTAALTLQCLDRKTGKEIWKKSFQSEPYKVHGRNSFASSTPAVDKNHVYIVYASPAHTMLVAVTHDGEKKWERDFGTWVSQHGFGGSPIIYKDKVIFFNSQQADRVRRGEPGESHMIALEAATGDDVWKTKLKATRSCYAVPCVYKDSSDKEQIVSCNTGDGFFSLDPETGIRNWSAMPFAQRTVASTLVADGLIIGSCGSGGGGNYLVAIRPGDTAQPEKAFQIQSANYVPSPIAVGGKLFLFTDKGIGQCIDLKTGKQIWQERLSRGFSGSPVATADHIYLMDEEGNLLVIAASDKYKLVSKHSLGEPTRSTPAISNDKMYLRTDSHLICVGNK